MNYFINTTVWLVSGPSCVGKTTFINNPPSLFEFLYLPSYLPAQLFDHSLEINGDFVLHYNILRPYHLLIDSFVLQKTKNIHIDFLRKIIAAIYRRYLYISPPSWDSVRMHWSYEIDPVLVYLKTHKFSLKTIVLVAGKDIIERRMERRRLHDTSYDIKFWRKVLYMIDLKEIYDIWLEYLRLNNIAYTLVDASDSQYKIIRYAQASNQIAF